MAAGDFSILLIPDSQYEAQEEALENGTYFSDMCDWIIANKSTYNIQAVMGLGDLVGDNRNAGEMAVVTAGMTAILNAGIPTILPLGNHDLQGGTSQFDAAFGENSVFNAQPSMYSRYESGGDNSVKNWSLRLTVGGRKFLLIAMEYVPRTEC